jgi:SAM-dependent methyltransferase
MTLDPSLEWRCPRCKAPLRPDSGGDAVMSCDAGHHFAADAGIVVLCDVENYAKSFGLEWLRHSRTQVDKFNGTNISRDRFFEFTRWPQRLSGEMVLEAGSGSGRFTQVLLDTGARVVSFDYSAAVHANAQNNGNSDRLTLFRGDIFAIPFAPHSFDRVVCLGVLQHTPDAKRAFDSLVSMVRPGGHLAVDIYRVALVSVLHPKYMLRPLRHLLTADRLYALCVRVVPALVRVKAAVRKIPLVGVPLAHMFVPVPDYRGRLPLTDEQSLEWSQLDLFDMISPAHDHPVTRRTIERWCKDARLQDVEIDVVSKGSQFAVRGRTAPG